MTKSILCAVLTLLTVTVLTSCCAFHDCPNQADDEPVVYSPVAVTATRTDKPIILDGVLDEEVWIKTPAYLMKQNAERFRFGRFTHDRVRKFFAKDTVEPGFIRLAYDDDYLYVAFDGTDSDLIAEGEGDQAMDCSLGDVVEIFLKPEKANYYWEIYLTPRNSFTVWFYRSRSLLSLPSGWPTESPMGELDRGVQLRGTLNDLNDRDQGWSGEIAIPLEKINELGIPFDARNKWRIFFGRYNFSQYFPEQAENTSFPPLPGNLNYHDQDAYGYLNFAE